MAPSGSINHWNRETMPGEVGDSTWHSAGGEPGGHKSPGSADHSLSPWPCKKVVVVLLALGQVSAS